MGNVDFFTTWALWEQMTFVLACAIVVVFFMGLGKLWWINRSVRKHELLDEEKKSRVSEIQKTGLSVRKRPDIPFGVRAIQSGIEVDGIWISRPGTPNSESPLAASTVTLNSDTTDLKRKSKIMAETVSPSPYATPSESTFDGDTSSSPQRSPPLAAQSTYRPKHAPRKSSSRAVESYNAETLSQTEQRTTERPALQTYVPKNSFSRVQAPTRQPMQAERVSSSSEEAYHGSPGRTQSPFPDLSNSEEPCATPEGGRARQTSDASMTQTQVHRPTRSFSGDTHLNVASRRVNPGFEVLPAGTFGVAPEAGPYDSDLDLERGTNTKRYSRPVMNKLQRRERSQSRS